MLYTHIDVCFFFILSIVFFFCIVPIGYFCQIENKPFNCCMVHDVQLTLELTHSLSVYDRLCKNLSIISLSFLRGCTMRLGWCMTVIQQYTHLLAFTVRWVREPKHNYDNWLRLVHNAYECCI